MLHILGIIILVALLSSGVLSFNTLGIITVVCVVLALSFVLEGSP
jgi:hypothetical protein